MEYVDGGGVVNITIGVCFTAGGLIGGLVAGAITGAVSSATLGLGGVLARFVGSIFAAGLTELINNALGGGGVYFTHTIRISKWWLPNINFNFVVDLVEMLGFGGGIGSGGAMKTKGGLVST